MMIFKKKQMIRNMKLLIKKSIIIYNSCFELDYYYLNIFFFFGKKFFTKFIYKKKKDILSINC